MSKSSTLRAGAALPARSRAGTNGKTKWTIAAVALAVLVGGIVVLARPDASSEAHPGSQEAAAATVPGAGGGQLMALRPRYNFGTISMAAGKVTHRYAISNGASDPVVIRKIYTSCMCTTAALVKNGKSSDAFGMPGHTPIPAIDVPLTSKDGAYIEVVFDPAAHGPAGVGPIERVVTVENNAGQPLELQFSATVTP